MEICNVLGIVGGIKRCLMESVNRVAQAASLPYRRLPSRQGVACSTIAELSSHAFLRGILFCGGIVALVLIVAGVIFGFYLGTFFSVAMVALAGAAILHDTSNVMHHYPEDRYVAAALELFASVALMFLYVLRLLMSSRR